MQTIPANVLDIVVRRYPELRPLASELRRSPCSAAIEQRIAAHAIQDVAPDSGERESGLTRAMIRDLAACAAGDPYGAQRGQTWIELADARDSWVDIPLAVSLSGGYARTHLHRLARSGRLTTELRNGERWFKRAELAALDRNPAGRPDVARQARRARLPRLRALFPTVQERRALVHAVVGVGHRRDYIRDLPEQVRIALIGPAHVRDGLDLSAVLEKIRALDERDREALVRALEFAWSRLGPGRAPSPEGLFTECL